MDFRHNITIAMATSIAVVVASIVTWVVCHWWYGRKLAASAQRLHKSDKARQFSQEQTQQARRQVEQLKTELESQQRQATTESLAAARQRTMKLAEEREAAERLTAHESGFMPIVAAHGFADTQILPD